MPFGVINAQRKFQEGVDVLITTIKNWQLLWPQIEYIVTFQQPPPQYNENVDGVL